MTLICLSSLAPLANENLNSLISCLRWHGGIMLKIAARLSLVFPDSPSIFLAHEQNESLLDSKFIFQLPISVPVLIWSGKTLG
jgi:hypothetical protein